MEHNVVVREISSVTVECALCGHKKPLAGDAFQTKLEGEPLSLKNIAGALSALKCTSCNKKFVRVFDDRQRLIFDPHNVTACVACNEPIPLPRLKSQPEATLCVKCVEEGVVEPATPPHPLPPQELATCPSCKSSTVVRQNSETGNWFVGCSTFPRCRETAELPA